MPLHTKMSLVKHAHQKHEVNVGVTLHNKFHIEVTDAVTGELVQEGFAENVVLNQAFTRLINALGVGGAGIANPSLSYSFAQGMMSSGVRSFTANYSLGGVIALGSGTTAPAVTQTALVTPVYAAASTVVSSTIDTADQLTGTAIQKIIIDAGLRIGDVYREVGLASNLSGTSVQAGYLSTRALIKDGNGDPLTITKIDLQVVTVTATVYVQISHGYGPNLLFIGTGTGATGAYNGTMNNLMLNLVGNPLNGIGFGNTGPNIGVGSSSTAIAQNNTKGTAGVTTALAGGVIAATCVKDAANNKVTYSIRVPSSVSGTIREVGLGMGPRCYTEIYGVMRFVLPIGNNSPTYDNVYATATIAKDNTNVVDVSFVLQFGSL